VYNSEKMQVHISKYWKVKDYGAGPLGLELDKLQFSPKQPKPAPNMNQHPKFKQATFRAVY